MSTTEQLSHDRREVRHGPLEGDAAWTEANWVYQNACSKPLALGGFPGRVVPGARTGRSERPTEGG